MAAVEAVDVDEARSGTRLDKLLAALPSVGSREKARQALKSGKVSVDGAPVGADDGGRVLGLGSRIEIAWTRPGTGAKRTAGREAMTRAGVVVVHEDDAIVVCDKPVGLLTDAADAEQAKTRDTLRKRVRAYLGGQMVWPAHRIDRDTSGLVAFARSERLRAVLSEQWAARTPLRCYLVLVEGRVHGEQGRFRDWMAWDGAQRLQRPCAPDAAGAFLAEADWTVAERFGDRATSLEVRLVSGRRNQIRLHAMLAGHPLVGEPLYRKREGKIPFPRQALHAWKLGFVHPTTGEPVRFEAPVPADLQRLLASLR